MGRCYSQYTNCPLPTLEDRPLLLLMYLKQAPTQVAHGVAFGMGQSKANQWIHVLLVALRNALQTMGEVPPRGLTNLQRRLKDTAGHPMAAPLARWHRTYHSVSPRPR
jgi:Helix-turn-helix of DDE superfamily endonuclease